MTPPNSCVACPHHRIIPDPDPLDDFCDDDVAVICTHPSTPQQEPEPSNLYAAMQQPFKPITVSCRPYRVEQETTPVPKWCPLTSIPSVKSKAANVDR